MALLGLLVIALIVVTIAFPTYTTFDSTYTLLWGREILSGNPPTFDAFRAPTQHPLWLLVGVVFALFGDAADRLLVIATIISFVFLIAGVYSLGRRSFTVVIGIVAAALVVLRYDYLLLAVRAYLDVPFLALLAWAAAWEVSRPRRGTPVMVLLFLAGLLRPEAWILAGIYWLYLFPGSSWTRRFWMGTLVVGAPLIWMATDYIVTGDPLFSQTHTSGVAGELDRQASLLTSVKLGILYLRDLAGVPLAALGLVGTLLAIWFTPRRAAIPLVVLAAGFGTFFLISLAGLSVIPRYLVLPALMTLFFAGFALGGFSLAADRRVRTGWTVVAVLVVIASAALTLQRSNYAPVIADLRFRGQAQDALASLLGEPAVRRAADCGPVLTPNHRMIPTIRWEMDLPADRVVARTNVKAADRVKTGLAILAANRSVLIRQGLDYDFPTSEDTLRSLPPAGYRKVASNRYFSAWARCR
ncbi:MAG: hypothetical protein ACKOB9_01225 [Solirubrobacterales bacterium]